MFFNYMTDEQPVEVNLKDLVDPTITAGKTLVGLLGQMDFYVSRVDMVDNQLFWKATFRERECIVYVGDVSGEYKGKPVRNFELKNL